jgi:hypothetical protein
MAGVVQAIWYSPEHLGLEVDATYMNFLHRSPSPNERASWVGALQAGADTLTLARALLDSPEYQAAHSSDVSFISGVYADLLGRSVDGGGLVYWEQALQGGTSRDTLVVTLTHSPELDLKLIAENYNNILHRPASAADEQGWLAAMQMGQVNSSTLTQAFLASGEFYNMAVAASQA